MIANVEKKPDNVQFHDMNDFLQGSSISYAILVDPVVIRPWINEFWTTAASGLDDDEEPFITATVEGRDIRINKADIRRVLMFNDGGGALRFDNEEIWDTINAIGYEGF